MLKTKIIHSLQIYQMIKPLIHSQIWIGRVDTKDNLMRYLTSNLSYDIYAKKNVMIGDQSMLFIEFASFIGIPSSSLTRCRFHMGFVTCMPYSLVMEEKMALLDECLQCVSHTVLVSAFVPTAHNHGCPISLAST